MKRRVLLGFVVTLWGLSLLFVFFRRREHQTEPSVSFRGMTNGGIGPQFARFAKARPSASKAIKAWIDSGTNTASFSISNSFPFSIVITSLATIYPEAEPEKGLEAPVLNDWGYSGTVLKAHHRMEFQVAKFPTSGNWRLKINWVPDQSVDSFFSGKLVIPGTVRAFFTGAPTEFVTHPLFTEWISNETDPLGARTLESPRIDRGSNSPSDKR